MTTCCGFGLRFSFCLQDFCFPRPYPRFVLFSGFKILQRHRVVNSIHAFITIGEVEASGKILCIQAEGLLKLNDGGVRLSQFKQSCAL